MSTTEKSVKFRQYVENKFQIYNSLFMSLPYDKMTNIGMMLPFLFEESKIGYSEGKSPEEIIQNFFQKHAPNQTDAQNKELLFKMIQYIERQVVLFDSIEDAAFQHLHSDSDSGTVTQLLERATQENCVEEVVQKLQNYGVKIVFTAHPTQFYPNAVQRILHDLRTAIIQDELTEIDVLLQQLGKTPFVNKEKPTPLDEALSIIFYLRYVYYDSIGELYQKIKSAFGTHQNKIPHHIIELGFWPGGDRDGNPFVTADITLKVAEELRVSILKSYYNHLKNLRRRLSFRGVSERLEKLSNELYSDIFNAKHDLTTEKILEHLNKAEEILVNQHQSLFLNVLTDFKDRVQIFGTHFATLDIRQDSRIHQKVIDEILLKLTPESGGWSYDEKLNYIFNENILVKPKNFDDELIKETLESIINLKKIQKMSGEKAMHRYIISNSDAEKDVLNVFALFKMCGYQENEMNVDIVPLFETMEGLDNAENVTQNLYQNPVYKKHLAFRKNLQTIMLGFSDGTKDGGYLQANWKIYETKEKLTKVSDDNNIKVIFFDGRGGPPARGGGKTHLFYASQGKTIANHKIELTIQGQTITSVFGNKDQAKYNFEQLLTAGIENAVFHPKKSGISDEEKKLMRELADKSFQKYTQLKKHPLFVDYLLEMSTLQFYGKTNIGSRPSKRNSEEKLKLEDLRAIPFVGAWSQLKQNVPGFFGLGIALQKLDNEGRFHEVKEMYQHSSFFKTLILNSMMAMNKSYFPLTSYMNSHPKFGDFWNILHDEYLISKEMTLKLTGYDVLMQEEPVSRKSVNMREKIVLPLLTIQQYALIKLQQYPEDKEVYEKLVIRSLFGNINASRNSA